MNSRVIISTLLLFGIGFFLEHLPMPDILAWFQPPWVLLIVTLLVLQAPHKVGVWLALPVGLLLDVEQHQLLGFHVLTLTVHITLLQAFCHRLQHFNNLLLTLVVIALVAVHQLVGNIALWGISSNAFVPLWQPVLCTALIWIWLRALFVLVIAKLGFK